MDSRNTRSEPLGLPAAVKALLRTVIDAGNAHGRQLNGQHVERQIADLAVAAEPPLAAALADLVVVVHQGNHLVAVPTVFPLARPAPSF